MAARRLYLGIFVAAALAAAPAFALGDLTGTYQGPLSCESTNDAESTRSKSEATVYVDDNGNGNVFLYLNNSLQIFRAAVVAPGGGDQGRLGGPACALSPATGGWTIRAAVKAKPGSASASMKGEFVTFSVGASSHYVQVCRFSLQRVSLGDPSITACP